jgi:hypothetical protein
MRKISQIVAFTALLLLTLGEAAQAQSIDANAALSLEDLARQHFARAHVKLSPTDVIVVRAAENGEIAWASGESGQPTDKSDALFQAYYERPENDPASSGPMDWQHKRSVHAALIRWLFQSTEAQHLIDPHGFTIIGAWINGPVDLSYLQIKLPIILSRCVIPQGIRMDFAEISDIDLNGTAIGLESSASADTVSLGGQGVTISGNIDLSNGVKSYGKVDLYGSTINGQLYCNDGTFLNPGGQALRLRLANVNGEADFRKIKSDGFVDLTGAKIGGDVLFNGADFSGSVGDGVNAPGLTVGHALWWTDVHMSPKTELDLANASIGALVDDMESWPAPGLLSIDGFKYGSIRNTLGEANSTQRLRWIQRQASPLRPQPFTELAQVFLNNGQDTDAKGVLIAKEAAMSGQEEVPVGNTPAALLKALLLMTSDGLSWMIIDYGYQPLRALWLIAAFVILGTLLFRYGYHRHWVIPTDHGAYEMFRKTGTPPVDYQSFNSFVYSLETFVPLIDLHQATYWLPNANSQAEGSEKSYSGQVLRWYLWIHIVLGWVFTSMLLAGLTGLIKA